MGKYQMPLTAITQLNCHDILGGIFIEGKQAAFKWENEDIWGFNHL
jgi:hypothetical protein